MTARAMDNPYARIARELTRTEADLADAREHLATVESRVEELRGWLLAAVIARVKPADIESVVEQPSADSDVVERIGPYARFLDLLDDLLDRCGVSQPEQVMGRPMADLLDTIRSAVLYAFTGLSTRART